MPSCQFVSPNDEVIGTSTKHIHVKSFSGRKADVKGQMSDVFGDVLFLVKIDARMHGRGEVQLDSVVDLLSIIQNCTGYA